MTPAGAMSERGAAAAAASTPADICISLNALWNSTSNNNTSNKNNCSSSSN